MPISRETLREIVTELLPAGVFIIRDHDSDPECLAVDTPPIRGGKFTKILCAQLYPDRGGLKERVGLDVEEIVSTTIEGLIRFINDPSQLDAELEKSK